MFTITPLISFIPSSSVVKQEHRWEKVRNMAQLKTSLTYSIFTFLTVFLFLSSVLLQTAQAANGGFSSYAGRWIGNGQIIFSDNKREKLTCRVTYFVKNSGKQLAQNIRCTSSSGVKFEIKSKFSRKNNSLHGTWKETNYNQNGSISGKLHKSGFNLIVKSQTGVAKMSVKKSKNRQSVTVSGDGQNIKVVKITLVKG